MSTNFYVYVLQSGKDSNFYVGYTNDLRQRLEVHQSGRVKSTKNRLPVTLIYWEGCLNQADATQREKYLKTAWGKRYLKNRLKNYLTGSPHEIN
jgi:putative endonuclease